MTLSVSLPKVGLRLINKYGSSVTITQEKPGTYNPATSTNSVTTQVQSLKAYVEEYAESVRNLGDTMESPSGIIRGDKKVTISSIGLSFIPTVGDRITLFSVTYAIINVAAAYINNVVAVYTYRIRRT